MLRAALYARFSTDQQNAASTADQLRLCRDYAAKLGAVVVAAFEDAGISGGSMFNRPGVLALLGLARKGGCDVVIAEHTDRLSRAGDDTWGIYKDLTALGVKYHTVNQGEITKLHVGLSGTMSELLIDEIARKTRRGQEGRVLAGSAMGSLAYGYCAPIRHDERGERIPGLRAIDPEKAEVVRRIYRDYAAGLSPWSIVDALNREGVPSPRGGPWLVTTISGNQKRGVGILRNELYRGVRVWGTHAFIKDRQTGKRRPAPGQREVHRVEVPELRIIDDDLWGRVQLRLSEMAQGPNGTRRPLYLLSGLIRCGCCGGPMSRSSTSYMRCTNYTGKGTTVCANTRSPNYDRVEARVLAGIEANLLHPASIEAAVEAFNQTLADDRKTRQDPRKALEREATDVAQRIARYLEQFERGAPWDLISERVSQLRARQAEIAGLLAHMPPQAEVVRLPVGAGAMYREMVANLRRETASEDAAEARQAIRSIVEQVRFIPLPKRGAYELEIHADLAPIVNESGSALMGAGESRSRFIRSHKLPVVFRLTA